MSENNRRGFVERKTAETDISLTLHVDGSGQSSISTGVAFLDHMLTLFAVHGFFDLEISATGDIEVDYHHTVEDVGICLGLAFSQALGKKAGIARYGSCFLPMDETLVRVAVDVSNRPFLHYHADVSDQKVGTFDTCLAKDSAVVPIMIGDEEEAFKLSSIMLEKDGIFVPPAIFPAVPKGQARLRYCLVSAHKETQIDYALSVLKRRLDSVS